MKKILRDIFMIAGGLYFAVVFLGVFMYCSVRLCEGDICGCSFEEAFIKIVFLGLPGLGGIILGFLGRKEPGEEIRL